jgi:hypothetical protein
MNQYILVHTSIYSDFLHTYAFISRYSIRHGTGEYNEVPKSPVHLDYDGTTRSRYKAQGTRYIKVQGFVEGSTKPCTLMYLFVPS